MSLQLILSWAMFCTRGVFVTTVLLVLTLNRVPAADPAEKCPRSPNVATTALKKKLFCNYDLSAVPVNDTTGTVQVAHILLPEFFVFDEYENSLEVHGDSLMTWKDQRLAWNEADYNGLDELVVRTKEIWMPDFDLITPASMHRMVHYQARTNCRLSSTGGIQCVIPLVLEAHCNPDIRRWPFDSQRCFMNVTTRTTQIRLSEDYMAVDMLKYSTDKWWMLTEAGCELTSSGILDTRWPTLIYSYKFKRHSGFLIATFIVPAIVMLMATLCVFCLDPTGVARIFIIGTNITCHCLFLMYLSWYLPGNGDNTPIVMTFFRDSLLLVGVSLLVTVWAAAMAASSRAPPFWLFKMADAVREAPVRCLLFDSLYSQTDALDDVEPDNEEAVMSSSASNKWRLVTTLIDRVSLLVFGIILALLASAYLPQNKSSFT